MIGPPIVGTFALIILWRDAIHEGNLLGLNSLPENGYRQLAGIRKTGNLSNKSCFKPICLILLFLVEKPW